MPGFNVVGIGQNGGAYSADGPKNNMEIRRKHRWIFETIGKGTGNWSAKELLVLQSASRPQFKFEEPEMHHNQEVVRFAGKQDWEPVSLTWYDAEQDPDISRSCYQWIETVCNMVSVKVNSPNYYKRQAVLKLLNGTGGASETWTMYGTWPTSVNWQELDYSATELLTVEATMRYDRAIRSCASAEPATVVPPSCGLS
jgi:hypothetical protein